MRDARRGMKRRSSPRGFTLWELTMCLLVMAIAATLAAPAFARLGSEKPAGAADALLGLLHDTRKAAITYNATTTLRIDPKTLNYAVDTSGSSGTGQLATGTLDLGLGQSLQTDQPRLQYVFRPTGAAFADTVAIRGASVPLVVRVDSWSGVARADSR